MEDGSAPIQEVLGWAPSYCGLSLVRDLGWDPSFLLETDLGLGRVQVEVSLPLGRQEWTSLRRMGMCDSSKDPWGNWEYV